MTHQPSHPDAGPFGSLPKGITEGDLLDWIEQRLPAARAQAFEAALNTDRQWAARLQEMRVDRAAVAALGDTPVPAGLLDAVERTLEREMLVGLATGEPLSDGPPISIVRPSRWSPFSAMRGDAVGRRLAMAAAVALLVGGAVLVGNLAMQMARSSTPPRLATFDGPPPVLPADDGLAPGSSPASTEQGIEVATNTGSALAPEMSPTAAAGQAPAMAGMTLARASELAREGRLIVRVRSADIDRTLLRFGRFAERSHGGWRLSENAPQGVVADLQKDPPRLVSPAIEPMLAGLADTQAPPFEFPLFSLPLIEVPRVIPTVFLARARADEASLGAMLAALDATSIHNAVFEEAPAPMPAAGAALDPDAVLWWAQAPSGWRDWAAVPVIVEKRDRHP